MTVTGQFLMSLDRRLHSVKDGRARFITASALTEYVAMLEAEAHKAA